eukprot:9581736-Karenia_brevis.AAC.1
MPMPRSPPGTNRDSYGIQKDCVWVHMESIWNQHGMCMVSYGVDRRCSRKHMEPIWDSTANSSGNASANA